MKSQESYHTKNKLFLTLKEKVNSTNEKNEFAIRMKVKRILQAGMIVFSSHMFANQLFIINLNFKLINYFIVLTVILKMVTSNSLKMDPGVVSF